MKISEIAGFLNVSTETLLTVIAKDVYELDVDFSSRELPDNVLSYMEKESNGTSNGNGHFDSSPPDKSDIDWVRETSSSHERLGSGIQILLERGKVALGVLAVLILSESRSERAGFIRELLRDLGGEVARDSCQAAKDKVNDVVEGSVLASLTNAVPLLSGISSIYASRLKAWLTDSPAPNGLTVDSNDKTSPEEADEMCEPCGF